MLGGKDYFEPDRIVAEVVHTRAGQLPLAIQLAAQAQAQAMSAL
jgi:hypothetical protein